MSCCKRYLLLAGVKAQLRAAEHAVTCRGSFYHVTTYSKAPCTTRICSVCGENKA